MGIFEYEFRWRSSPDSIHENELTSRVFGIIEVVGDDILEGWLGIKGLNKIEYWPKFKGVEPDAIITDKSGNKFIIECKLWDFVRIKQIKKEYKLAQDLSAELVVITGDIIRPKNLSEAEKEIGVKEGYFKWTTWSTLYQLVSKSIGYVEPFKEKLFTQLRDYLEWMKMGYNFGELMEKYRNLSSEKWTGILHEEFKEFLTDIKDELETKLKEKKGVTVSKNIHYQIFGDIWINMSSSNVEDVDDNLYYYLLFDFEKFNWLVVLGGWNKETRSKFRDFLAGKPKNWFSVADDVPGCHRIACKIIVSDADYNNPQKLKDEIATGVLDFINNMDNLICDYDKK